MATYNGAEYLQEQLDSFVVQTCPPDELVVADDGSTDDTLCILHAFAQRAPFAVKIVCNDKNLGYAQNFSKAMGLCSGDIIFLSDQDDVWLKEKIAALVCLAKTNPDALLFLNDAELTTADGSPLGLTMLGQTLSLGLGESAFTTGCCMAIRRDFLELALPVPAEGFVHDTWLNRLALCLGARHVIPRVLQYYRRHGQNTSSWLAARTEKQGAIDLIKGYQDESSSLYAAQRLKQLDLMLARLASSAAANASSIIAAQMPQAFKMLAKERKAVVARLQLLELPRSIRWFEATQFYCRGHYAFFSGWKSWLKDMFKR